MHAHLVEPPPRPSERDPSLPRELDALIAEAVSVDPRKRPRSPAQLIHAAGRVLGVDARVPLAADLKRQRGQEKEAARKARRARRRAARRGRPPVLPRRAKLSLWVIVALAASAVSGFATGNASWSPGPAPPAAPKAAVLAHADYLRTVDTTIEELVQRRSAARRRLRESHGSRAQAAGATALAAAYREAHDGLPAAPVTAGSMLKRSLWRTQRAYARLATAARRADSEAWRSATAAAVRNEKAAAQALRRMRASDPS
jgi:hypothetical protein